MSTMNHNNKKHKVEMSKKTSKLLLCAAVMKCKAIQTERGASMKKSQLEGDMVDLYYGDQHQESVAEVCLAAASDFQPLIISDEDGRSSRYLCPLFQDSLGSGSKAWKVVDFEKRLMFLDCEKQQRHAGR